MLLSAASRRYVSFFPPRFHFRHERHYAISAAAIIAVTFFGAAYAVFHCYAPRRAARCYVFGDTLSPLTLAAAAITLPPCQFRHYFRRQLIFAARAMFVISACCRVHFVTPAPRMRLRRRAFVRVTPRTAICRRRHYYAATAFSLFMMRHMPYCRLFSLMPAPLLQAAD